MGGDGSQSAEGKEQREAQGAGQVYREQAVRSGRRALHGRRCNRSVHWAGDVRCLRATATAVGVGGGGGSTTL